MFSLTGQEKQEMKNAILAGRLPNPLALRFADRATHQVFAALAGVRELRGPAISGLRRDVTAQDSGGWQELIAVLKTGSQLVFDLLFDDSHQALLDASLAQSVEVFQLVLTNNISLQFSALVGMDFRAPLVGALRAVVTLTLTGEASRL